jgi:uncharacterized protein (TIGR04255 family)
MLGSSIMEIKRIPIQISPCPLIEAVVDFRFESPLPSDAIFGIIYKCFQGEFEKKIEKLPILQLPEQVRVQDPNLRFQPWYRLKDKDFLMQIGPQVVSFINLNEYVGWNTFFGRIRSSLNKIQQLDLVEKILRLGLRYINFFDFDIYKRINLELLMANAPLAAKQMTFRATLETGSYLTNLNIVNNAVTRRNGQQKNGSLLDIDTYIEKDSLNVFADPDGLIGGAHNEEKMLFFKLLKEDLLAELNPIYGG